VRVTDTSGASDVQRMLVTVAIDDRLFADGFDPS
jgi:hypothetical protein